VGQTGGHGAGGGPDTPWTVDHDAAGYNLKNLHQLGFKMTGQQPTFTNQLANLTVAFNAGAGSDDLGQLTVTTAAGFAGAAAGATLFTVNLFTAHSAFPCAPVLAPNNNATALIGGVPATWFGVPSAGFGLAGFDVRCTVALPAGAAVYLVLYQSLGI
jgi:hypothetical protein